jgi:DNA polymerase beta
LRTKQDELNDVQKVGLQYYEQILERIPRSEIVEYDTMFKSVFSKVAANDPSARFEIVGSYRRGAQSSGDIDVIITGNSGAIYKAFIDELIKQKIILNVLSRGTSKTLVIAQLPGKQVARRVDFLYSSPDEFPFAILYFTGSKAFNTVMRNRALAMGYTLNEHGLSTMENKVKGAKIEQQFADEKAIFDFLKMDYKTPVERADGRAVVVLGDVGATITIPVKKAPTPMKVQSLTNVGSTLSTANTVAPTPMKAQTKSHLKSNQTSKSSHAKALKC